GTGKMTRLLNATGARVIAVEPLPGMRAQFELALPDIEVRDGTAAALPVDDFARVLRPGGRLALVWNVRDTSQPWTAAIGRLLEELDDGHPRYATGKWREAFVTTDHFSDPERAEFPFEQPMD